VSASPAARQAIRLLAFFAIGASIIVAPKLASARELVSFERVAEAGSIIISTSRRQLFFVIGDGTAIRYRVAVGRPGKQWFGTRYIDAKHVRPAWAPPAIVKRDNPDLPDFIPGGASNNPMGVAALTLAPGADYAIHGTNKPSSIGTFASYGCIRMRNEDIADLYQRVRVGTRVTVIR
jgi:lipoprotein-anchoring transpeptidase ErfK/SrfK